MYKVANLMFGRCSLPKALYSVLDKMKVENTIYTKIMYPNRKEREKIDFVALREAVVNAIVHNDYSNGASPKFEFFSDRLEIVSAGGLPYGFNEEDFYNGLSSPRNKEIMRVFRDLGIVEHLGSGIPRIMEKYDIEPFEITENFIKIVFKYEVHSDLAEEDSDTVKDTDELADLDSDTAKDTVKDTDELADLGSDTAKDTVKDTDELADLGGDTAKDTVKGIKMEKLTPVQVVILKEISVDRFITIPELSEKAQINIRNTKNNISKLKVKGLLKRIGSDKSGYWEVV